MKLFSKDSFLDLSYSHVMGILNITPDSFFDGGLYSSLIDAIQYTNLVVNDGATIIDIGGESTRPGSEEISTDEELSRVIPVVEAISKRFEIWISVNTSNSEVIYESAQAGAHIINDIRSLSKPKSLETAAKTGLSVCLMHMQGQPKTMQNNPSYDDVFDDVNRFFIKNIERCERAGISRSKLLIDPGFGFGKTITHNYELLSRLSEFHKLGLPLLVGMSRKSMISQLLDVRPNECLNGSLGCAVIAAMQGAQIIRVHDVKETMEAISVVRATLVAKGKYYE